MSDHPQHAKRNLRLSWPLIVSNLSTAGMMTADTLMAGHLGAEALAAVAVGSNYVSIFYLGGLGLLMALSPTVAHVYGAGRSSEVGTYVRQGLWLATAVAALVTLGLVLAHPVLRAIGTPPQVADVAARYAHAVAFGMPAMFGFLALRFATEGLGWTRRRGLDRPHLRPVRLRAAAFSTLPPDHPRRSRRMRTPIDLRAAGVALLVAALLTGCIGTPVDAASGARPVAVAAEARTVPAADDPARTLELLYEEFFEEQLRLLPTMATYLGDERYNDRLENPADPAFSRALEDLNRRYLERARRVDPTVLDGGARISYDIFVRERELALAGLRFPARLLAIDQMDSLATTFAVFGSGAGAQPFRTARDYDAFLARSLDFERWVDSAIDALREGLARGVTQPRVVVTKVIPQLRDVARTDPEQTIFWQAIRAMPESIPSAERAAIEARWRRAIAERIVPAYRRLADFLENEYLPRARTSVGWSALPQGAEWYRHQIRVQTTTSLGAEEIHAIGLAEVARIRAEMDAVRRRVGFEGDLAAFFRYLQDDPKFYFTSAEQLVSGYTELKRRIDGLLPRLFADFPKADYEVRLVEPFRAASAPGAFYQPPSADGRRPGIFYVNAHNLKAQPIFGMETLSLHEAAPGHHFQVAIQQELTGLPRFRRFNNYVAYAEGWALYAESIGPELGLFTDPYQWYGRLSDEMLRAMRLVVDTGLHAKGWSRRQAIEYMRDNSSMAPSDIEAEVERYIVWPGQALGYKVGQLRISALRERAERVLGARFDVREFHSQVLRDGAVPLDVLEAKIERWITARAETTDRS